MFLGWCESEIWKLNVFFLVWEKWRGWVVEEYWEGGRIVEGYLEGGRIVEEYWEGKSIWGSWEIVMLIRV